jgi:hypothetical protein
MLFRNLLILLILFLSVTLVQAETEKPSKYDMDVEPTGGILANDVKLRLEGREYDKPFMSDIERLAREVIDEAKMPRHEGKFTIETKTLTFILRIDSNIAVAPVKAVIEIERVDNSLTQKQMAVLYYNPEATDAFKEGLREYLRKYLNAVFPASKK